MSPARRLKVPEGIFTKRQRFVGVRLRTDIAICGAVGVGPVEYFLIQCCLKIKRVWRGFGPLFVFRVVFLLCCFGLKPDLARVLCFRVFFSPCFRASPNLPCCFVPRSLRLSLPCACLPCACLVRACLLCVCSQEIPQPARCKGPETTVGKRTCQIFQPGKGKVAKVTNRVKFAQALCAAVVGFCVPGHSCGAAKGPRLPNPGWPACCTATAQSAAKAAQRLVQQSRAPRS